MAASSLLEPLDHTLGNTGYDRLPLSDSPGATSPALYPLQLEGQCRTYVMGFPLDAMSDFSDQSKSQYFVYAWLDSTRGCGSHVHYQSVSMTSGSLSDAPAVEHTGDFKLSIDIMPEEVDLLKIMCCVRIKDDQSNNTRDSVICTGAARLTHLIMGAGEVVTLSSVFDRNNTTELHLRAVNAGDFANSKMSISPTEALHLPLIRFKPSTLWRMNELQDHLSVTCDTLKLKMDKFHVEAPFRSESFVQGQTSWEFSGAKFNDGTAEIMPFMTHYGFMNTQMEALDRRLPIQLVCYHIYLRLLHSGMSARQALALPPAEFGRFIGECCQITRDACLVPYERDTTVDMGLTFNDGLGFSLMLTDTEDMGLPCGAPQFLGRTIRPLAKLFIPNNATIPEICAIMQRAASDPGIGGKLGAPYLTHQPLVDGGGLASSTPQFHLSGVCPAVMLDDCESSTELAVLARNTLKDFPYDDGAGMHERMGDKGGRETGSARLCEALRSWPLFASFTPECHSLMAQICRRGASMFNSGTLQICTTVGVATNASAGEEEKGTASYCGHCFNVGRVYAPPPSSYVSDSQSSSSSATAQPGVYCFLLEGTAPMDEFHVQSVDSAIQVPVKMWHAPGTGSGYDIKPFLFHEYLALLSRSVAFLTQVINTPNGGHSEGGGIPSTTGLVLHGWLAGHTFCPSLHSDPAVRMSFYHRVMCTGLGCGANVKGSVPVEQSKDDEQKFIAGCHPYSLSSMDLRGLDVPVPSDKYELMKAIMNEAHPPLVDPLVFRRLSDLWAPCAPLCTVNTSLPNRRLKGVPYVRVACMETPAIPEFVEAICRMKAIVCDLTNEINLARPDSDGVSVQCSRQGTGCHLFIDVPVKAGTPTIVHSMRSALKRLNYPGYVPVGDEDAPAHPP